MNRTDLICRVAEATGDTKKDITEIIDVVFTEIMDAVASGERVALDNFGIFNTKTQKGRSGTITIGVRKGEPYTTEDKTVVTFKPSKVFADSVAGE